MSNAHKSTPAERRQAFVEADAIMALEGFQKTPEMAKVQEAVIQGSVTFDQAVKTAIDQAKIKSKGKSA